MRLKSRRMTPADAGKLVAALIVGTCGGLLFNALHLPLPWMLGSMSACGLAVFFRGPVFAPPSIRPPMTATIGTMLGASFHPGVFDHVAEWLIPIAGLAVYLLVVTGLCYIYFTRLVRMDHKTAFFSSMPGGLVDMVLLGAEKGADERQIALVHAARIFLVVLLFPIFLQFATNTDFASQPRNYRPWSLLSVEDVAWFLLAAVGGIALGRLLRLPAKYLMGPMLFSSILHFADVTEFVLPTMAVSMAQIVLGATIGCRFAGVAPRIILKTLAVSVGSTSLMLTVSLVMAEVLSSLTDISLPALLLAYSPAGLAEMSLIALAMGLEVPMVVVHHLLRIGLVVALAPLMAKLLISSPADNQK